MGVAAPFDREAAIARYRATLDELHALRFRANAERNMTASHALSRKIFDFQRLIRRLGWMPRRAEPLEQEPRIA